MTKLHDLAGLGQSIWYDNIRRELLENGEFQALLDAGVLGVTSNPTIFEKAIAHTADYDPAIARLAREGHSTEAIYEALAIEDISRAADMLRPVYDRTGGVDGYVSLEVSPLLAHDTERTIADARRLFKTLARPNIMIKVPATPEGIPAVEQLISEGINVNVTLIFSLTQYVDVAEAYVAGLEELAAAGGDLSKVASVASFFVSRVDTKLDKRLADLGNTALQGKIAIAKLQGRVCSFHEISAAAVGYPGGARRARAAAAVGQHLLPQNPAYPDTIYVDNPDRQGHGQHLPPQNGWGAILDHCQGRGRPGRRPERGRRPAQGAGDPGDRPGAGHPRSCRMKASSRSPSPSRVSWPACRPNGRS
jgi:transaldolase